MQSARTHTALVVRCQKNFDEIAAHRLPLWAGLFKLALRGRTREEVVDDGYAALHASALHLTQGNAAEADDLPHNMLARFLLCRPPSTVSRTGTAIYTRCSETSICRCGAGRRR